MKLEDLSGWMKGEDCAVVGCGPSAAGVGLKPSDLPESGILEEKRQAAYYSDRWTIACNRAVRFSSPDFAVCIEPSSEKECWEVVASSSPVVVFSHIERPHPRCVLIGSKDVREWLQRPEWKGAAFCEPERLRLNQSPFFAIAIAGLLGFETIGVIGVDLMPDRYEDKALAKAEKAYGRLRVIVEACGSRVLNLNPESRLQAFETGPWSEIRTK